MKSLKEARWFIFIIISLFFSSLILFIYRYNPAFIKGIDLKLQDVRFRLKKGDLPDPHIAIVAIDEKSVNEIGRWPWKRSIMAKLIDSLSSYGAKVIALDIVFSESSDPEEDLLLARSIKKAGNVVLGYFFRYNKEEENNISIQMLRRYHLGAIRLLSKEIKEIPVTLFPYVETNIPVLATSAKGFGFFNIFPDRDGICRNYNLIAVYKDDFFPSLALAAAREYLLEEPIISIASYGIDSIIIGGKRIPVDESGRCTINYYGSYKSLPIIPAVDVIKGRIPKDLLKGKAIFIGATEIGISDLRATPINPALPGVLIHATILSNILQGRFIIRDSRTIVLEVLFMFLFPITMAILLSLITNTLISIIILLVFLLLYGFINLSLFSHSGLNLSMIYPFLSILFSYMGCESYRNLVEVRQRRFLQKAFSSYVSPDLVSQIVENPEILRLGGEKREITVLFSDIRGFTSISERFPPETIVEMLNRYLDPMTKIVLSNRGTLDKYIGDAIMAIYNAPLDIEDHPYLACKTAVEMIDSLRKVNEEFRKLGFPEIDIGIGIHTGEAVVGNMGTDTRFDYTAIGDTVNLASRLESLNKQYRTHIIVSEFTKERIRYDQFKFRELDKIRVKGKELPVVIYELSMNLDDELIRLFHEALYLYREGRFHEALKIFSSLEVDYNDSVSSVFSERCRELILNPPEEGWDGVYTAKTK